MLKAARVLIISLFSLSLYSQVLLASNQGYERGKYICSTKRAFDIATYYADGWGSSTRFFIGFCSQGILKNRFYGAQNPMNIKDLVLCNDDESDEKKFCMEEFLSLNPIDKNSQFLNQNIGTSIENIVNSTNPKILSKQSLASEEDTQLLNKKLMGITSQDFIENAVEMNATLFELNLPTINHETPELMVDLSHSIGTTTSQAIGASFDDGVHKFCFPCEVGHNDMSWGIFPYLDAPK